MSNVIEYGGYHARIEFDSEDMIFVGNVFGINDSLSFHGTSIEELKDHFKACVEDYLQLCSHIGKEPEKEFRGSFNVRIDPELHKEIAFSAFKNNCSMNKEIEKAISEYLNPNKVTTQYVPMPIVFPGTNHYSNRYGLARNSSNAHLAPGQPWLQNVSIGG